MKLLDGLLEVAEGGNRRDVGLPLWTEYRFASSSGHSPVPYSVSVTAGGEAAAQGRADLEAAAGGPDELAALIRGSRPSIDPAAGPGEHAKNRQVRLRAATNRALDELAAAQGRTPAN